MVRIPRSVRAGVSISAWGRLDLHLSVYLEQDFSCRDKKHLFHPTLIVESSWDGRGRNDVEKNK